MAVQLGAVVVANLAATSEGCLLLLRSPVLANTEQQLHHLLQRRDGPQVAALLQPLINLASHAEGQKQILRAATAPGHCPASTQLIVPHMQQLLNAHLCIHSAV